MLKISVVQKNQNLKNRGKSTFSMVALSLAQGITFCFFGRDRILQTARPFASKLVGGDDEEVLYDVYVGCQRDVRAVIW